MRQLHKLLRLEARKRNLLFIALVLLTGIRLGLWLLHFRTLFKLLVKISQPNLRYGFSRYAEGVSLFTNQVSIGEIIWAVNAVSRYMPGVKCLARALTTYVLMNRYSYTPELRIGVAKTESGKLEAHAWVEHQGRVAIGNLADLYRFIPLPSLEAVKL